MLAKKVRLNLLESVSYNSFFPLIILLGLKLEGASESRIANSVSIAILLSQFSNFVLPLLLSPKMLRNLFRLSYIFGALTLGIYAIQPKSTQYLLFLFSFVFINRFGKYYLKLRLDNNLSDEEIRNYRVKLRKGEMYGIILGSIFALVLAKFTFVSPIIIIMGILIPNYLYAVFHSIEGEATPDVGAVKSRKIHKFPYSLDFSAPAALSTAGINIAIFELILPILIISNNIFSIYWIILLRFAVSFGVILFQPIISKRTLSSNDASLKLKQSLYLQALGIGSIGVAITFEAIFFLILGSFIQTLAGCFYSAGQIFLTSQSENDTSDVVKQLVWTVPNSAVVLITSFLFFPAFSLVGAFIWFFLIGVTLGSVTFLNIYSKLPKMKS